MLWFYERDQHSLTLETRYDADAAQSVVSVRWPDGREQIERFSDLETFRDWLTSFDRALEAEYWQQNNAVPCLMGGPPSALPSRPSPVVEIERRPFGFMDYSLSEPFIPTRPDSCPAGPGASVRSLTATP